MAASRRCDLSVKALLLSFVLTGAGCAAASPIETDNLDFGAPAIWSSIDAIPQDAERSGSCLERVADIDCEFRDDRGVYYLVFGHTLTRKRVVNGATNAWLPYGLHGDETPNDALTMLRTRFDAPFQIDRTQDAVFVGTYARANGLGFDVTLEFGLDNRLRQIVVGGSTPED
jgi:hypothetical protein